MSDLLKTLWKDTIDYYINTPYYQQVIDGLVADRALLGLPTTKEEYNKMLEAGKKFLYDKPKDEDSTCKE